MRTNLLTVMTATGLLASFFAPAYAADYDLAVTGAQSPAPSPKETQSITFTVANLGENTVESFLASASQNGDTVAEETITPTGGLAPGASLTVTLNATMTLEYGFTDNIRISVNPVGNDDENPADNILAYDVTMPWLMEFPYTWTDENAPSDFTAPSPWIYSPNCAFNFAGSKPSLTEDITSGVFDLGDNSKVKCSFVYNSSDTVCITLLAYDGDTEETLSSITLPGNGGSYNEAVLFGTVSGAVQFKLRMTFPERPNSYAVFNISNIDFSLSLPDMRISEITAPVMNSLGTGDPVNVSARFDNISAYDIVNPVLCYNALGEDIKETYDGVIKSGETIEYTFTTPYIPESAGKHGLKVWCEAENDSNPSNDVLVGGEINYYQPMVFPYHTEFDADTEYWNIIDTDGKGWTWEFGTFDDGNNILGYRASYGSYDDYAISPAINLPEGITRLSFYYSGMVGGTHLKVLAGRSPQPEEMSEVMFDQDVNQNGWRQAYYLFNVEEAGNYYFAFHLTGSQDQLVIDKLSFDTEEDLCIGQVRFKETSGFNLSSSEVMMAVMNHGLSPQKNIEVGYSLDGGELVKEILDTEIMPGDTLYHTFATPANISEAGHTYTLTASILTEVGSDRFNDNTSGASLTHYANQTLPYYFDFSDAYRASQWAFASSSPKASWTITTGEGDYVGTNGSYDNTGSMKFSNKGNGNNDAWAFSECVEIPAGTYDISFFYRTSPTWDWDSYRQNFEVFLGEAAEAEAMTSEICRMEEILVNGNDYKKFTGTVTVEQDGKYFIGFHSFGSKRSGYIQIDALALENPAQSIELPYTSDFTLRTDEWYHYNPGAWYNQWAYSEDANAMQVTVNPNYDGHTEGLLVSPRLIQRAGDTATVSIQYALETENPDVRLHLYTGEANNPDSLMPVAEFLPTDGAETVEYTIMPSDSDRDLYLGFRSNFDHENDMYLAQGYTLSLISVAVETDMTGVKSPASDNAVSFRITEDTITAADATAEIRVYDVVGNLLAYGTGEISTESISGVCIVVVTTANGSETIKTIF